MAARPRAARPRPDAGDGYLTVAAQVPDYEQAGELKFGQVGIANLRVRTLDADRLAAEMAERVQRAPKLFERAAVVVDFGGLFVVRNLRRHRQVPVARAGARPGSARARSHGTSGRPSG